MIEFRYATLVAALLVNVVAIADQSLVPHIAEYKVQISVLRGQMSSRLDGQDGAYTVTSNVRPTGLARLITRGSIRERSQFEIAGGRVRPSRHSGSDTLTSNGQDVEMQFDWSASKVVGEAELWCAQSLSYLPVVIEQYRDGKLKGRVVLSDYRRIDP